MAAEGAVSGDRRSFVSIADSATLVIWSLAALSVVGGLVARVAIAWRAPQTLVMKVLPDDAFYYLLTAEHISNGHNVTFDGFTVSNGYHPLWLFSLVPIYLLPGRELPLHVALTFASVLDVLAGVIVGLAVMRLTGNRVAGLFALSVYMFLPQNVFAAVNGVESAMTCLMLSALLLTVVSVWLSPRDDWLPWALVTGVLGGLTVLARLDSFLVVGATLVLIALFQSGPTRWRAALVAGGVVCLVVAPWLIWGAVAAGGAIPVSGQATAWLLREFFAIGQPDASLMDELRNGWDVTERVFRVQLPGLYLPARPFAGLMFAGMAAVLAHFAIFSRGEQRREIARNLLVAALPLAGFALMLLVNSGYRWSVREWYFAWGIPTVILAIGVLFDYLQRVLAALWERADSRPSLPVQGLLLYGAIGIFLAIAYVPSGRDTWRTGLVPFQNDNLSAARYLKENTEPDARIAAFNAGVIGYFSERSVVNIDGVVNRDALEAMQDHELLAYLRRAGVDYAADRDGAWTNSPVFIRPDDWQESLWGEDPNAAFEEDAQISQRVGFFPPMRVWRLVR